ncbi:MAG: hypothetical protein SGCHY_005468, partial [Lobulomycetales sp.]
CLPLDHPSVRIMWTALSEASLVCFIHPHYGVGGELIQDYQFGHVLPLALGFPFETTTAIARLVLSGTTSPLGNALGIFDLLPDLKLLLAHSGGTLPFLAGRLDSCVSHDPALAGKLAQKPSEYLKKLYFDAVCYSPEALKCLLAFTTTDRVLFGTSYRAESSLTLPAGTDNPFFPPLGTSQDTLHAKAWKSVVDNKAAIKQVCDASTQKLIFSGNAERIFSLAEFL